MNTGPAPAGPPTYPDIVRMASGRTRTDSVGGRLWGRLAGMTPLSTGVPLAERYLLIEQLGAGGMSVVWRGFDDVLGRPVAVKVLSAPTAADVYGLGTLLYEMLTGEPPVPAKTWTALVEAYRTGPATIPALSVPGLPDSVREVVRRCLVADPAARPGTAEVAQILVDARASADPAPTPARGAAALAVTRLLPQVEEPLLDGAGSAEEAAGRSRRLAIGVAATAVVVLITAALLAAVFADRGLPQAGPTLPTAGVASSAGTGETGSASPSTAPSTTASAPAAAPASPSGHPSASTSPVAPLVVVDQLITQVQTDADAGEIRPDAALDLENVLHQLRVQIISAQPVNYPQWVGNFRTKISLRIGEQAITESSGMRLLSLVDQLSNAGA